MNKVLHIDASGALEGISNDQFEELNKSLMDNSLTDDGEKPFTYGIATMNFSGVSKTEVTEPTKRRKEALNLILRKTQRHIILWQECKWASPLQHIQTKFLDNDRTRSGDEAGIIYNSNIFDIQKIENETLWGSNQIEDDKLKELKENRGRLCIGRVNYKDEEKNKNEKDFAP